jgi:hypothetical protein
VRRCAASKDADDATRRSKAAVRLSRRTKANPSEKRLVEIPQQRPKQIEPEPAMRRLELATQLPLLD